MWRLPAPFYYQCKIWLAFTYITDKSAKNALDYLFIILIVMSYMSENRFFFATSLALKAILNQKILSLLSF